MTQETAKEILEQFTWYEGNVRNYLVPRSYIPVIDSENEYYLCDVCDNEHPNGKLPQRVFGVDKHGNVFECSEDNTPLPLPQ